MNRHMQRRNTFSHYPLEIQLGKACEGGEVAVEKRQPVVVVFEVERFPKVRGQLINKTKLAVVVASADLIEEGRVNFSAERLSVPLFNVERKLESTPIDIEAQFALVSEESVRDDVARNFAVQTEDLVPR